MKFLLLTLTFQSICGFTVPGTTITHPKQRQHVVPYFEELQGENETLPLGSHEEGLPGIVAPPIQPRLGIVYRTPIQPPNQNSKTQKSSNFEVTLDTDFTFDNVGGYEKIKEEMLQCAEMLANMTKYEGYSVRVSKGMILEGPPGNGKTLLARGFSGSLNIPFIATSGSIFQEKYVGVGAARIRELFDLAAKNAPCIIFIDEVDALARSRRNGDDGGSSEQGNTLNELLTQIDGFKPSDGIFLICATNRVDILDSAFLRPGRMDKKIYIGNPDLKTRKKIADIHLQGKPHEPTIDSHVIADMTNGQSGAGIENILNEAMLLALRNDKVAMTLTDVNAIISRGVGGYQDSENVYSDQMLKRIAVHEVGHGISGLLQKDHPKLIDININPLSPRTPGYCRFENSEVDGNIHTREALLASLTVLLSGRMAENVFFDNTTTTGASHDLLQARTLAESMILDYNMGTQNIYSATSDKFKEIVDEEITSLLEEATQKSNAIIKEAYGVIDELSDILITERKLTRSFVENKIFRRCARLFDSL